MPISTEKLRLVSSTLDGMAKAIDGLNALKRIGSKDIDSMYGATDWDGMLRSMEQAIKELRQSDLNEPEPPALLGPDGSSGCTVFFRDDAGPAA